MFSKINDELKKYADRGETVALAQVVWNNPPSSGKPGDKAVIDKHGNIGGWVGGGCIRGIVIKEALSAIREKRYKLVKVAPENESDLTNPHLKKYRMTCESKGSVDIFIEPVLPPPHLLIVGNSELSRTLAEISKAARFKVGVMSFLTRENFPGADQYTEGNDFSGVEIHPNTFVLILTQGENDEKILTEALNTQAPYVGFLASRAKAEWIREKLTAGGMSPKKLQRLHSPVGLDIGAKSASEVSVSILAEIIQIQRNQTYADLELTESESAEKSAESNFFINPVCKIPISKKGAKHIVDCEGHRIYFCCDGCKTAFDREPQKYMAIMRENHGAG